jgi:hypothetical protein
MQDQASAPAACRCGDAAELMVLSLLLEPQSPGPWALGDLASEVGCELATAEAIVRLQAAGLAHQTGRIVFASRAASRFRQLLRE